MEEMQSALKSNSMCNSKQDPKMEDIASSLYLTHRAKSLKANTWPSTKANAGCSQKENHLFKATQYGNYFKAAISQCLVEWSYIWI